MTTAEIEPVQRVYGIESELGYAAQPESLGKDYLNLAQNFPGKLAVLNMFYSNGAKFYPDVGDHMEYATPECQTIGELVGATVGGEELLTDLVTDLGNQEKDPISVWLNTRIIADRPPKGGDPGEPCRPIWGSHENYLTLRNLDISKLVDNFVAHSVTRYLLVGAGWVDFEGQSDKPKFNISQRASRLSDIEGASTTQKSKPIFNTRDEALAHRGKYRRLHVINGDPTMSPWATAVRIGSMSLLLRMNEHPGFDLSDLTLEDPLATAQIVSEDLSFSRPVMRKNGKTILPIELQVELASRAKNLTESVNVPKEELILVDEWLEAAMDLEQAKDWRVLTDRSDYAAKARILQKYWDLSTKDEEEREVRRKKIKQADHLWGELSDAGLARKWRSCGAFRDPLGAMDQADYYKFNPPKGRADIRARFIATMANRMATDTVSVDWHILKVKNKEFKLHEPLASVPVWVPRINDWLTGKADQRIPY